MGLENYLVVKGYRPHVKITLVSDNREIIMSHSTIMAQTLFNISLVGMDKPRPIEISKKVCANIAKIRHPLLLLARYP
jgi:hypothetical protein